MGEWRARSANLEEMDKHEVTNKNLTLYHWYKMEKALSIVKHLFQQGIDIPCRLYRSCS